MNRRVNLQEINPLLLCALCGGYYVDATTIIECVHSFCRSCIVKHLESSKYCPICEVMVHKTKPLTNIRRDKTLQDIVYKLVPGLHTSEMRNRQEFYKDRPHYIKPDDIIDSGEDLKNSYIFEDSINLSLTDQSANRPLWFLKCPIGVTIQHLKKLILAKYGFKRKKVYVEVMLMSHYLEDDLTLLEISCVRPWRSKKTIEMSYEMLGINEQELIGIADGTKPLINKSDAEMPEPVEKEIQLQITESGVMCVSEVDSRQNNEAMNQIIASSLPTPIISLPKLELSAITAVVDNTKLISKERKKRMSSDEAIISQPKRPFKGPEPKNEKKVLSHSVYNMVAKESKSEESAKNSPQPVINNEEKKVPEDTAVKKVEMPIAKHVAPPVSLYSDKPKPVVRNATPTWRPLIPKEKLRPTLIATTEPRKPAKPFKMRNMPRYLGNPASGVKPLYSNGLAEAPQASPAKKSDPIIRIDPKTLRPVEKEETKTPNTLLTSPFIPRDKYLLLPDPKTQPYPNVTFPPGLHASLPPTITHTMSHKSYRSAKGKEDGNCCDSKESRPSASSSKPEPSASSEPFKC